MSAHVRIAAPAVAATALVLLVFNPTPAAAYRIQVTLDEAPIPGGYQYDYTVTDGNSSEADRIDEIWVPERLAGDLVASTLPTGWSATETTSPIHPGLTISDGAVTVGAQITLQTLIPADQIPADFGSADFIFTSLYGDNLLSQWRDFDIAGSGTATDVAIPDSSKPAREPTTTPEPASIGVLGFGLLGLCVAVRRRRGGAASAGR